MHCGWNQPSQLQEKKNSSYLSTMEDVAYMVRPLQNKIFDDQNGYSASQLADEMTIWIGSIGGDI